VPARDLVLASASPARRELLRAAGIHATVDVSGVDESGTGERDPHRLVLLLAERKAAAVAARHDGPLVVGCDSVLDLDGTPLGKPADAAEARDRWRALRGRDAVLRTGHCVVDTRTGATTSAVSSTVVRFGTPADAEVEAYVATGEPLATAGAFTIDGRGGAFVEGIDGDHGTVVGLSLPLLRTLLARLDVTITDLWS
jgi:septum formation protein